MDQINIDLFANYLSFKIWGNIFNGRHDNKKSHLLNKVKQILDKNISFKVSSKIVE